jgi:phosphotransferase system enzyme I (PtsP)
LLGVLVVQQGDHRRFSEDEEAFLITVSAQLAGLIAHAELAGAISQTNSVAVDAEGGARLSALPLARGSALGLRLGFRRMPICRRCLRRQAVDRLAELKAFRDALASVRQTISAGCREP